MSKIEKLEAHDVGGDVLEVTGEIDGEKVVARGWVSALENHYADDAYDADGNLKLEVIAKAEDNDDAEAPTFGDPIHDPAAMSKPQRRAYCEGLLRDQAPKRERIAL